jgi:hypothetical protein
MDRRKRVERLETALRNACDWIESAITVIDDLDPGDIDGESAATRRQIAEWRALLTEAKRHGTEEKS